MSAYFGIDIEFDIKNLHSHYVADFYNVLEHNGAKWIAGARDSEGLSRKEATRINQKELEGLNTNKYHQNYFQFQDFTEARGYWWLYRNNINYHMIFPEDDLVYWDQFTKAGEITKNINAMNAIENLCRKIWEQWDCLIIQTAWEASDLPDDYDWIVECGYEPQTLPFSIIPKKLYKEKWKLAAIEIGNDGMLLKDENGWEPI